MHDESQQINRIKAAGFSLSEKANKDLTIAFISLRIALKAWFSTYQAVKGALDTFDPSPKKREMWSGDQFDAGHAHTFLYGVEGYFDAYCEVILHFHHFFELILKDILRRESEVLVVDVARNPMLLYKLIKGEALSVDDIQDVSTISFSTALDRLKTFLAKKKLDTTRYGFLYEHRVVLEELNRLRNLLVHRGTFVLPYKELDEMVGHLILPVVKSLANLPEYVDKEELWVYTPVACGIDPLSGIQKAFSSENYNMGKLALLKEFGRAAYCNPTIGLGFWHNPLARFEAQRAAAAQIGEHSQIKEPHYCPVCGIQALVLFDQEESVIDLNTFEEGFIYKAKCYCCTFEIERSIRNASEYGFPIEDYWDHI